MTNAIEEAVRACKASPNNTPKQIVEWLRRHKIYIGEAIVEQLKSLNVKGERQ